MSLALGEDDLQSRWPFESTGVTGQKFCCALLVPFSLVFLHWMVLASFSSVLLPVLCSIMSTHSFWHGQLLPLYTVCVAPKPGTCRTVTVAVLYSPMSKESILAGYAEAGLKSYLMEWKTTPELGLKLAPRFSSWGFSSSLSLSTITTRNQCSRFSCHICCNSIISLKKPGDKAR